jgi:hypothetical protein
LGKLGSGRQGADGKKMLILFGKNMVWKFTSQKVGYNEHRNELFLLASEVGLFYKNVLYLNNKLL